MRRKLAVLALACAALLGCGYSETADQPGDAPRGRPNPIDPQTTMTSARPAETAPAKRERTAKAITELKKAEEEDAVVRDLDAELKEAFGTPLSCLKPRTGPDVPPEIRIDIEATLIDNGMVTRSEARSAQLDDEELRCVRQRLSSVRLREPIEEAPRSARAAIQLTLKTPEKSGP